jgi:LmbE family N-acetylglucosaminyl deacetylase
MIASRRKTRATNEGHESSASVGAFRPRVVLCIGAHADDIEIGCGGTLLRLVQSRPGLQVHWHVLSATGARQREARASARAWLRTAGRAQIEVAGFRESYFPDQWAAIKDRVEQIRATCEPNLIFTHWRDDAHQDHRVVSELTWNAFRSHTILEYEIPKYDGDLGRPNVYVGLDDRIARRKVAALMRHFRSQATKHWFTADTFYALMRLRGIECGGRTRFAEAFHARKLVV